MISKTIGCRGTPFSDKPIYREEKTLPSFRTRSRVLWDVLGPKICAEKRSVRAPEPRIRLHESWPWCRVVAVFTCELRKQAEFLANLSIYIYMPCLHSLTLAFTGFKIVPYYNSPLPKTGRCLVASPPWGPRFWFTFPWRSWVIFQHKFQP